MLQVGKDVANSVVRHIASSLSVPNANPEPSNLETHAEIKWTMEVYNYNYDVLLSALLFSLVLLVQMTEYNSIL